MIQPGGDLDLPHKPVGAEQRRNLRAEHLDRDRATVLQVAREVDCGHAAATQLAFDGVLVRERRPEAGNGIGHRRLRRYGRRVDVADAGSTHYRPRP